MIADDAEAGLSGVVVWFRRREEMQIAVAFFRPGGSSDWDLEDLEMIGMLLMSETRGFSLVL
jgi:hypothetical protein